MKFLLLLVLFAVIWWSWKKRQVGASRPNHGVDSPPENMLVCSYCGVHQPESSCLKDGDKVYCCEAHRSAAQSARH